MSYVCIYKKKRTDGQHMIILCALCSQEGGGGGGAGTLNFSAYVGSDPASTLHPPKNIRNFKHPKKLFEILETPKIPPFCTLTLRKDLKMHRNDP